MIRMIAIALVATALAACESTKQASTAEPAGFLMDTQQLAKGGENDFTLAYWDQDADIASYDKAMIDPVTIWLGEESELRESDPEERTELANTFRRALEMELGEEYEIVERPGPGTLRIRAAITDAAESNVFLDTISTFSWQARILSEVVAIDQEMAFFVGAAAAELEVKDSETGRRIGAAIDQRVGRRNIDLTLDSWGDAEGAFEAWSRQLRNRLRALGGKEPIEDDTLPSLSG